MLTSPSKSGYLHIIRVICNFLLNYDSLLKKSRTKSPVTMVSNMCDEDWVDSEFRRRGSN
jgi:hypothetical protein